jgi:hypothetical protein
MRVAVGMGGGCRESSGGYPKLGPWNSEQYNGHSVILFTYSPDLITRTLLRDYLSLY